MKILATLIFLLSLNSYGEGLQKKLEQRKNSSKAPDSVRNEFNRATNELRESGIEKQALGVGAKLPDFKIGENEIKEIYKKAPVIIKFYRGHWCPYCIIELKEYESQIEEINKYGSLIALVPDTKVEILKTQKKHSLNFNIYQDKNNQIAKKIGLAFKVDPKVLELYKNFSIDLEKSQGNTNGELPMPGTYVINKNGKIVYAFFDADYTKRADPKKVIQALKEAANE